MEKKEIIERGTLRSAITSILFFSRDGLRKKEELLIMYEVHSSDNREVLVLQNAESKFLFSNQLIVRVRLR